MVFFVNVIKNGNYICPWVIGINEVLVSEHFYSNVLILRWQAYKMILENSGISLETSRVNGPHKSVMQGTL